MFEPDTLCRLIDRPNLFVCIRKLLNDGERVAVYWKGYPDAAVWVVNIESLEIQLGDSWVMGWTFQPKLCSVAKW